ncbi:MULTISPECIES: hypothetical protein [Halorussus]|uniref:hypothetical protein n=1 Tax=Halorussus TaxID=1070314 RepID=UPI00209C8786|nr:hypothetical protein [Halorussus vallis]USZ78040.1 hypothetical protein NGM07_20470 [Halorussus vallis]
MTDGESASGDGTGSGTVERFDVLRYDDVHRVVPAGDGRRVVVAHESEARQRRLLGSLTVGVLPAVTGAVFGVWYSYRLWLLVGAGLAIGGVAGAVRYLHQNHRHRVPEVVASGASTRVVRVYVDGFEPDEVSPPFE